MIIPFIFDPAPGNKARWLYEFLEFVKMQSKESFGTVIAQEEYICPLSEWKKRGREEVEGELIVSHSITQQEMDRVRFCVLPEKLFEPLFLQTGSLSNMTAFLVKQRYIPWEEWLEATFSELQRNSGERVEALIMFRQFHSVDIIAKKHNVTIFYYDAGAFRGPVYRNTIYLDTYGFFTNCGLEQRFRTFCEYKKELQPERLLSAKEILALMLEPAHKNKVNLVELSPEYQCGVALQSGIADLMLPESHTRNEDLIAMAVRNFPLESILTRGVPGSTFDTFGTRPDSSEFACDFIAKCECIITRASNMAYEALLYGRQMYCAEKGLYQFKGMHDLNYPKSSVESDAWLVAFVAMGFYVPREFLYDMQYLRWRIEAPSEIEIYNKNLDYYLVCRGISQKVLAEPPKTRWSAILYEQGFDPFGYPTQQSRNVNDILASLMRDFIEEQKKAGRDIEFQGRFYYMLQQTAAMWYANDILWKEIQKIKSWSDSLNERLRIANQQSLDLEQLFQKKNQTIQDMEQRIAEKDQWIQKLETQVVEKDRWQKKLEGDIQEQKSGIAEERKAWASEKKEFIQENECLKTKIVEQKKCLWELEKNLKKSPVTIFRKKTIAPLSAELEEKINHGEKNGDE